MKWICEGKGWSGGYGLEVTDNEQEFKQKVRKLQNDIHNLNYGKFLEKILYKNYCR